MWELGWIELRENEPVFIPLECGCHSTGYCDRCRPRPINIVPTTLFSWPPAKRLFYTELGSPR